MIAPYPGEAQTRRLPCARMNEETIGTRENRLWK